MNEAGTKPDAGSMVGEGDLAAATEEDLRRIARMFLPYRDDPLMRELCRLAVRAIQEGWIRV